jgi:SAM-dependent methyltransferase
VKARQTGVADVTFVVGDAARLPFANASFDTVSCSHIWSAPRCKSECADRQKEKLRPYIRHRGEVPSPALVP